MKPLLFADLHCHLLPGLDDGPRDVVATVALARALVERGVGRAVASSHITAGLYPNHRQQLLAAVEETRALLRINQVPLSIIPGAEVRLDSDSCRPDTWLTVGDAGRYLLVEPPPGIPFVQGVTDLLQAIRDQGVVPIIAHPERVPLLQREPELLMSWVAAGALAQGTLSVLGGAASDRTIAALEAFLRAGLIHVMASDAHAVDRRIASLDTACARLEAIVGAENAHLLCHANPAAVLMGQPVQAPRPRPVALPMAAAPKRWWGAARR